MNRRDFLKLLGVTTAAAALPVESANAIALPEVKATIEDAVIDAPVTSDLPWGWIDLAGQRYQLDGLNITHHERPIYDFITTTATWYPSPYSTWRLDILGLVDYRLLHSDSVDFAVRMPGFNGILSGKGHVSAMGGSVSALNGSMTCLDIVVNNKEILGG